MKLPAAASDYLWSFGARATGVLAITLTGALLARALDPADFGRYQLVFSSSLGIATACAIGLTRSLPRAVSIAVSAGAESEAWGAIRVAGRTAIWLSGVLLALAFLVLLSPLGRANGGVLGLALALAAFRLPELILPEAWRGLRRFRHAGAWSNNGSAVLALVAIVLLIVLGDLDGLTAAVIVTAAGSAAIVVLGVGAMIRAYRATSQQQPRSAAGTLFSLAGWGATTLAFFQTQFDLWLVAALALPEELALYSGAFRLMLLISFPLLVLNLVVTPTISVLWHESRVAELQQKLQAGAAAVACFSVVVAIVIVGFADDILETLYGSWYGAAAPVLVALTIAQLFNVLTGPCGMVLMFAGLQRAHLTASLTSMVVGAAVVVLGYTTMGIQGAAWAMAAYQVLRNGLYWLIARRRLGVLTHADPRALMRELSRGS